MGEKERETERGRDRETEGDSSRRGTVIPSSFAEIVFLVKLSDSQCIIITN